jgi:hypothetical protein
MAPIWFPPPKICGYTLTISGRKAQPRDHEIYRIAFNTPESRPRYVRQPRYVQDYDGGFRFVYAYHGTL